MSLKPSLFVTRKLADLAMLRLAEYFDVTVNREDRVLSKEELLQGVRGKDALLCLLTDSIDASLIASNPQLKAISNYAVGYNNIDIAAASAQNIPVCYTPGVLTETTADLVWALILSVARRVVEADTFTRRGLFQGWGPELFLGCDVYGKTLGIVGMGRIGQAVARRASGFGMKILYHNRTPLEEIKLQSNATWKPLDDLLKESDIISLHVPSSKETHHLIGQQELAKMKPNAILINTARGSIVDEKALVQALKSKTLLGAGLDVYEEEPWIESELLTLPNTVVLPHIGSASVETRTQMAIIAAENLLMLFQGKTPHAVVNTQVIKSTH